MIEKKGKNGATDIPMDPRIKAPPNNEADETAVDVLGIPLYTRAVSGAVNRILRGCTGPRRNFCVSATGAHGIVHSRRNPDFAKLLRSFHMNLPDGMPGVWIGRLKGARRMERCYGPDLFSQMMTASAKSDVTHFLCGGTDGVAAELERRCVEKFGNANICGTWTPPFLNAGDYDYERIARTINDSGAGIVWIGISTPKQEEFAARLAEHTDVHFLVTVGAAFDFHIGSVRQAPLWMQKRGLEWLFRLYVEPRRLWRRYLEIVPLFICYSAVDLFRHNFLTRFLNSVLRRRKSSTKN
ncbi:MAG: WecB/TagA/CpsF family glycosyltransferase [Balneolaceae bacterium]